MLLLTWLDGIVHPAVLLALLVLVQFCSETTRQAQYMRGKLAGDDRLEPKHPRRITVSITYAPTPHPKYLPMARAGAAPASDGRSHRWVCAIMPVQRCRLPPPPAAPAAHRDVRVLGALAADREVPNERERATGARAAGVRMGTPLTNM